MGEMTMKIYINGNAEILTDGTDIADHEREDAADAATDAAYKALDAAGFWNESELDRTFRNWQGGRHDQFRTHGDHFVCTHSEVGDDVKQAIDDASNAMDHILRAVPCGDLFDLQEYGRCEIDDVEWVAYTDGAYRHVVAAADFDKAAWRYVNIKREDGDDYTEWCGDSEFADDETAIKVAEKCNLEGVHSADGTCGWLPAEAKA